jgi:hypothetical protein
MKTKITFLTTILITVAFSITKLHAQDDRRQAINICAVAMPVMNMYVVNYEYLYHERHGMAARIEFVPNLEGADTKGNAWGAVLDYRWHFSPKLNGFFVGPYVRYRYSYGSGTSGGTDYDFKVPEIHVGINGGFRWVTKIGINLVFAYGYGYSFSNEELSPSNSEVNSTFNSFKNAEGRNNVMLDAPYYAEFSIGYAF